MKVRLQEKKWARHLVAPGEFRNEDPGVPLYPRDLLGELYRGVPWRIRLSSRSSKEWKDVWMRPPPGLRRTNFNEIE